jgi:alkanal monooxygenase alpha chain
MNGIKWGVFFTTSLWPGITQRSIFEDIGDYSVAAEQMGYDGAWTLEHHFTGFGLCGNPLMLAAYVLGKTTRLKVGTAVSVLPFEHPVRLAEQVAMIDQLSKGRLYFGIGRGSFVKDFKVFQKDMTQTHQVLREWVDIMQQAWTTGKASANSDLLKFDQVNVYPEVYTKPHPPIYVTASSPSTVEWCAQHGFPMILEHLLEDEMKVSQLELYNEVAKGAGFDPTKIDHVLSCAAGIVEDDAWLKQCTDNLMWFHDELVRASQLFDPENKMPNYRFHQRRMEEAVIKGEWKAEDKVKVMLELSPIGSPKEIIEKLQRTINLTGIKHIVCGFEGIAEKPKVLRSMARFREEVIPFLHPKRS